MGRKKNKILEFYTKFISIQIIFRMGWLTCTRYLQLENERTALAASTEGNVRPNAYTPVALILLKGIVDFNSSQFNSNASWLVSLLSQLILCNDPNIRSLVSHIYVTHIDHVVLNAMAKK